MPNSPDAPYEHFTGTISFGTVVGDVGGVNVTFATIELWVHHPHGSIVTGGDREFYPLTYALMHTINVRSYAHASRKHSLVWAPCALGAQAGGT